MDNIGQEIHSLARKLWPLNRSLTGDGVRDTLKELKYILPNINIMEVASGTRAFDWVVPKEWKVESAWIITPDGSKICDFSVNNLHLLGYSTAVNKKVSLEELQGHLYSLPDQPDAIPYITSYYKERWGFCISEAQRGLLKEGVYEVHVQSELFDGYLTYGELVIEGDSKKEIFLSTYVCHPSMANNELSGPVVATFIGRWLSALARRKYTYRIIFIPETIGSLTYLSRNLKHLQQYVVGGFNISCIGDDRSYSYLPSRRGDTLSDRVALHVLNAIDKNFVRYGWADRGSDERQYCAPLVDLPIASMMRTKYGQYDEYHTSLDDLDNVVTPAGLKGGYEMIRLALETIENNNYPMIKVMGEPQLGKRGLYPTISTKNSGAEVQLMMDIITWSDGTKSLLEIAEICDVPIWQTYSIIDSLVEHELLELLEHPVKSI
jgi:aminopeptidase-like protein